MKIMMTTELKCWHPAETKQTGLHCMPTLLQNATLALITTFMESTDTQCIQTYKYKVSKQVSSKYLLQIIIGSFIRLPQQPVASCKHVHATTTMCNSFNVIEKQSVMHPRFIMRKGLSLIHI